MRFLGERESRENSPLRCTKFVDRHGARDFRDTPHIRITLSAKRYISIRHSGKAASIRAVVPDMRRRRAEERAGNRRRTASSSVSEFMNRETLVTRGYPVPLLGSMGLTSPYDKIA